MDQKPKRTMVQIVTAGMVKQGNKYVVTHPDGKKTKHASEGAARKYIRAMYSGGYRSLREGARPYRLGIKGKKLKASELKRVASQYKKWKKRKDQSGKADADKWLSDKPGPTTASHMYESPTDKILGKIRRLNEVSKMKARKALALADDTEYENYKLSNRKEPVGDALLKRIEKKWGSKESDKAEFYSDLHNYPKKLAKQFARGRALGKGHLKLKEGIKELVTGREEEKRLGKKVLSKDQRSKLAGLKKRARWEEKLAHENELQKKLNWNKIASRTGKVGRGGERG